ncbi:MAG: isocitrate lyase/PEP mutase family protein [Actinomycetota bacterium]
MPESKAVQIRDLLAAGKTINMPGVYDALTARLATAAGFEVLFISGYSVAASRLGMPDYGYLTQVEMADTAAAVCSNSPLPVIVDADTGYGNPLNTIRTARLFGAAGAAGIFLEDQVWPKRCGHFAGKQVIPAGEWLAKLRAVVDLREEGIDLFIVARTDARGAESLEEAIERGKAARDLGVDAVFVEAPESIGDLEAIAREITGAVLVANMIEGGRTPLLTDTQLHELGFDLIVTPLSAVLTVAHGVAEAFRFLREEGTLRGHMDALVPFKEFEPVVDLDAHRRLEEKYR